MIDQQAAERVALGRSGPPAKSPGNIAWHRVSEGHGAATARNRRHEPIAIVGGGPTGLSTAYHLQRGGEPYVLVEKEDRVGGLCRSYTREGFTFDHAGHIFFTKHEYVRNLVGELLDGNLHSVQREAWAYYLGTYIGYPFQANSYGLPFEVQQELLTGAAEAIYQRSREWPEPAHFEEWMYRTLGDGITNRLMKPYNEKVWATPPAMMAYKWMWGSGGRVPQVKFEDVLYGAFHAPRKDIGPNSQFQYPLRGGFESIMRGFLPHLDERRIRLNTPVQHVDWRRKVLTLRGSKEGDGRTELPYSQLVSTMPLRELIRSMDDVPSSVQQATDDLLNTTVLCVNVAVGRPNVSDKHWIYYPDPEIVFQRIFCMSNASPFVAPPGTSSFICEISTSKFKPVDRKGLVERAIHDAIKVRYLRPSDQIIFAELVELPYAYLVQDLHRDKNLNHVKAWLNSQEIYPAGRFGEWRYINSDEAILAGREVAMLLRPHLADAHLAPRLTAATSLTPAAKSA